MISGIVPVLCLLVLTTARLSVSQLTDEDKQFILDFHNDARDNVDPIATNMEKMEWNDELAGIAQAYSAKCNYQPNPDRVSQAPSFSTVGENLGVSMPPSPSFYDDILFAWVRERSSYNYTSGQCFSDGACDPYTQMVWATSSQLGCGATQCNSVAGFPNNSSAIVFVCNYAPAGNLEGQSPYMTGNSSCSNCPGNKTSCVSNLCSEELIFSDEDKQLLLDLHNEARSMVDPIATNMEEMEWNDELAEVAQNYSTNCITQLNSDRASQAPSFSTVGENSGIAFPVPSQVVERWLVARRFYIYTTGQCNNINHRFCDQYIQMVWATSGQLGCGVTRCSIVDGRPFRLGALVLVCNYGPAGRLKGQSPYMTGNTSCSSCPDDKKFCVNNLCSNDAPTGCSADRVDIDGISVAGGTVTINFSSDPNVRFRCRLRHPRYRRLRPCTSPMTYTGLSEGRYRFVVRAACPGQRLLSGPRNVAHFTIRA